MQNHRPKLFFLVLALALLPLCNASAKVYPNENLGNTPTLVAAGQRVFDGFVCINLSNAPAYLHFYDAATAGAVTVGTTVQVYEIPVPQTGYGVTAPTKWNDAYPIYLFQSGIVVAVTTSPLSSGSTGPSTGLVLFLNYH